jgi:microsomal dipeptidase-like Zn-dependent dipeptidase
MGIEHVGLGADFVDQLREENSEFALDGFAGPEEFPALVTALRDRGYEGPGLEAIVSGNWLRILRGALA